MDIKGFSGFFFFNLPKILKSNDSVVFMYLKN